MLSLFLCLNFMIPVTQTHRASHGNVFRIPVTAERRANVPCYVRDSLTCYHKKDTSNCGASSECSNVSY